MEKSKLLDRCGALGEDRLLLAKVLDRAEQAALRREYIDAVLGNLSTQLDHTYVVDQEGHKRKLEKKGE